MTYLEPPPPNEIVALGELRPGDWVAQIGDTPVFPERRIARIAGPLPGSDDKDWLIGWDDGSLTGTCDPGGLTAQRLPPSEAVRRDALPRRRSGLVL